MPDGAEEDALSRAELALAAMLTENRVHSAASKVGRLQTTNAGQVVDEIMRDLRDELDRSHGALVLSLTRDDAQLLWSVVLDDVTDLVTDALSETSSIDPE